MRHALMAKTGSRLAVKILWSKNSGRDEVSLIEQRTALINQLRHALAEYYPTALEAFEDWCCIASWIFLQRFPTPPQILEHAGKRQWEKFLHSRHLWRADSGPRRMELFAQATEFGASQPTIV